MTGNGVGNPLVTVLLTVYNRPSVISTVKSIIGQTYANFEFIIIDNASTDSTCDVIKKVSDGRIRLVVNEKNMGQTFSLNRGLQLAKGKYIARIDADDIALPTRLEKQVSFLENNPEYGLCGSWVQFITDDDKLAFVIKTCATDEGIRFLQTFTCAMYHPAVMIRKSVLDEHNLNYDSTLKIAEDYDMWSKILKYSKATNLPEILLYYRRGNNNDSKINAHILHNEYFKVRERICNENILDMILKNKILNVIEFEKKERKSFVEMTFLYLFYMSYLRGFVNKSNKDYAMLKRACYIRVFETCIANNNTFFAKFLYSIYNCLRNNIYTIYRFKNSF